MLLTGAFVQLTLGEGLVNKTVTFDFPHHLGKNPLYDDYYRFIGGHP